MQLSNLEILQLGYNSFTCMYLEAFVHLHNLKHLDLSNNSLTRFSLTRLMNDLINLAKLSRSIIVYKLFKHPRHERPNAFTSMANIWKGTANSKTRNGTNPELNAKNTE
jgi:hypothetical protein